MGNRMENHHFMNDCNGMAMAMALVLVMLLNTSMLCIIMLDLQSTSSCEKLVKKAQTTKTYDHEMSGELKSVPKMG